ncbi:MAG: hypothetical protein QGI33_03125 [Candidatus Brocadiia bacterium]|nr:hypothetical protein [Candidatus Brocadiia bacterium]
MKLPPDLSGRELAQALARLGHDPIAWDIKVGTLSAILHEVAVHAGLTREELLRELPR